MQNIFYITFIMLSMQYTNKKQVLNEKPFAQIQMHNNYSDALVFFIPFAISVRHRKSELVSPTSLFIFKLDEQGQINSNSPLTMAISSVVFYFVVLFPFFLPFQFSFFFFIFSCFVLFY